VRQARKHALVQGSQLVEVLIRQALATRISGMGMKHQPGLSQPLAQRFGVNGEQATTVDERETGHESTS
jgi:hypothetical protein